MKSWQVWTAISIVLMLGAPVVWFFGLRTSELAVASPRHTYVLEVPKMYFLRERTVEPITTDAGTVEMATLVAAPLGVEPVGYGLVYVEMLAAELAARSEDEIVDDALRGGVEAFGGEYQAPAAITVSGHHALETRFAGMFEGHPLRGRIRGIYLDGEVVAVMAICGMPGCEDDPDRLRVLDGFTIR